MTEAARVTSQATEAYGAIRSGIVAGRYAPDSKLKIQDLAVGLDVSPGAIREALSRLLPDQLVVSRDQRGFTVAPVSLRDLEELTELRCEVEALALRKSIREGDIEWEAGLVAASHRLRAQPPRIDGSASLRPEWVEAHAIFHEALVAGCRNQRIRALHAQLYEQSERYRGLAAHHEAEDRDVPAEHQRILDLALARDADALVDMAVSHIRTTANSIVAVATS